MAELPLKEEGAPCEFEGADQVPTEVLDEHRRSIVYIETPYVKGTGSIVKFGDQPLLMTCNHVIPTEDIAGKSCIFFGKENAGDKPGIMVKGADLFCSGMRCFLTRLSEIDSLDVTLIAIKMDEVPKFNGQQRLKFDLSGYKDLEPKFSLKEQDAVNLWHYPEEGNFCRMSSSYIVNAVSGHLFTHLAETHRGSSGAPVFKICKNRLVVMGLHRAEIVVDSTRSLNVATRIHAIWCLLKGIDHGLEAVDPKAFAKKGSSQEGSREVPVKAESSGQDPKGFDSDAFMTKYSKFPKQVKAQTIARKLKIDKAIDTKQLHAILNTDEDSAGEILYSELQEKGTPILIRKVCKAMIDKTGNPQMNKLGRDMLADLDLNLPEDHSCD